MPAAAYWHGLFGSEYWLARFVFQRALALIYLLAFLITLQQFPALLGENGLLPVPQFLKFRTLRRAPSIFHFYYSDRLLLAAAGAGAGLSVIALLSLSDRGPVWFSVAVWSLLYLLYLSIVNVGQIFYGFGWETMLLEAGALAIFLGSASTAVPIVVIFLLRWMLFRVEFGAGLIKLRGDPCWRNLTCLYYHHETQPIPNPLSIYFHHLPKSFHKLEVAGNFIAQLVVPWGLFFPQPVAAISGAIIVATQMWLFTSGNYSWLNLLTMVLALSSFDNAQLRHAVPVAMPAFLTSPLIFRCAVLAFCALAAVLSYWPIRNLLSGRQAMNRSFNPFHLINTYGAFGTVTQTRFEIILEGTDEAVLSAQTIWKEYEFKAKPGNPRRRPPQIAPYHLRLDWLMWFAAMSRGYEYAEHPWLIVLVYKLLKNDPAVVKLLAENPFPRGPRMLRGRLYHYRFATAAERREGGAWWVRSLVGEYLSPVFLQGREHAAFESVRRA